MGLRNQKDDGELDSHRTPRSEPNNRSVLLPFKSSNTLRGVTSPDPYKLQKAHVVITSYTTVASEHASFAPNAKDESSKSKSKKSAKSSGARANSESDSSDGFTRKLNTRTTAGKTRDALFRVKWFRIVLGNYDHSTTCPRTCTKHVHRRGSQYQESKNEICHRVL